MTRPLFEAAGSALEAPAFEAAVGEAAELLMRTRVLATLLDNGAAFCAFDEAAAAAGIVHLPLSPFSTTERLRHTLAAAGVDTLVAAPSVAVRWPALRWLEVDIAGEPLALAFLPATPHRWPDGTAKLSVTSGGTGAPKGVCLSVPALQAVAGGVAEALAPLGIERHLAALPHAVLLENVAGLMAARRAGATVVTRPLAELGLQGRRRFDAACFDAAVRALAPHSLMLLPRMLRAWCALMQQQGLRAPPSLRFVGVGGGGGVRAAGAPRLQAGQAVKVAQSLGLPVGEGWGLAEGASVQTLNLPGATRAGSVGRVLPHARVRVADDGELLVAGSLFSGYFGNPAPVPDWWPTGDLGHVDAEGFVYVRGRKHSPC